MLQHLELATVSTAGPGRAEENAVCESDVSRTEDETTKVF